MFNKQSKIEMSENWVEWTSFSLFRVKLNHEWKAKQKILFTRLSFLRAAMFGAVSDFMTFGDGEARRQRIIIVYTLSDLIFLQLLMDYYVTRPFITATDSKKSQRQKVFFVQRQS